ncbi:hypothetical protein E2C01_013589 [Portunus trituberculatus]|uniref:Uncharacterized protein n=1 Tax=Portunus trituberculatus TaxID=210409 RepID=A0A5B7DHP5_PORTR|nr:hypothetical protein [Portunus trituberculatus]
MRATYSRHAAVTDNFMYCTVLVTECKYCIYKYLLLKEIHHVLTIEEVAVVEEKKAKLAVCEWEGESLTDIEIRSSNARYSRSVMCPKVSQFPSQDAMICELEREMQTDPEIQFT